MDYETTLREIERKLQQSKQIASFYRGLFWIAFAFILMLIVGIVSFYAGTQVMTTL